MWFGDKAERDPLRDGFLKKKVALNQDDAALDQAIAEVGQTLKGAYNKNRVTVYYLLARSSANSVSSGERNAASRRPGRKSRPGAQPSFARPTPRSRIVAELTQATFTRRRRLDQGPRG